MTKTSNLDSGAMPLKIVHSASGKRWLGLLVLLALSVMAIVQLVAISAPVQMLYAYNQGEFASVGSSEDGSVFVYPEFAVGDSPARGWLEPEWQWARDVSIVYTWVNGSDPEHLALKSKYTGRAPAVDSRDRSQDELRYSLRSVVEFLPWHKGKIFIVSPGQTPSWLKQEAAAHNMGNQRIVVVDQADIMPDELNPTFNSFAIEFYLDKIPGVADYMIQLNDDYFFNKYTPPSFFFTADKRVKMFRTSRSFNVDRAKANLELAKLKAKSAMPTKFVQSMRNTNAAIKEVLDDESLKLQVLEHAPYVWPKSTFAPTRFAFRSHLKTLHRFRNAEDIIPTYTHIAYIKRLEDYGTKLSEDVHVDTLKGLCKFGQIVNNLEKNAQLFDDLRTSTVNMFNINDDVSADMAEKAGQQMHDFLEWKFPQKSPFEI